MFKILGASEINGTTVDVFYTQNNETIVGKDVPLDISFSCCGPFERRNAATTKICKSPPQDTPLSFLNIAWLNKQCDMRVAVRFQPLLCPNNIIATVRYTLAGT